MNFANAKFLERFLSFVVIASFSLLVAIIVTSLLVAASFYVHEAGHIAGCAFGSFVNGWEGSCAVSNYTEVTIFGEMKVSVPQQTAIYGKVSKIMALTGPVLSILFFVSLTAGVVRKFGVKERMIWAVPIIFTMREIGGNVICGTDNSLGIPQEFCAGTIVGIAGEIVTLLLIPSIALLAYPRIEKAYRKFRGGWHGKSGKKRGV